LIWFIWSVWSVWFNQTNETDQINKRDQSLVELHSAITPPAVADVTGPAPISNVILLAVLLAVIPK
jgi:hypothetical protein